MCSGLVVGLLLLFTVAQVNGQALIIQSDNGGLALGQAQIVRTGPGEVTITPTATASVLSAERVKVAGNTISSPAAKQLLIDAALRVKAPAVIPACDAAHAGHIYYSETHGTYRACDGTAWQSWEAAAPTPLAARTCKDILNLTVSAPSGFYDVNLGRDGRTTRVYCDMTTSFNSVRGWTRIFAGCAHHANPFTGFLGWDVIAMLAGYTSAIVVTNATNPGSNYFYTTDAQSITNLRLQRAINKASPCPAFTQVGFPGINMACTTSSSTCDPSTTSRMCLYHSFNNGNGVHIGVFGPYECSVGGTETSWSFEVYLR